MEARDIETLADLADFEAERAYNLLQEVGGRRLSVNHSEITR